MNLLQMKQYLMRLAEVNWYRSSLTPLTCALLPLSWLFGCIIALRSWCYRRHIFNSHRFNVPVIVVGNLAVGGTGKTPCVISLAKHLIALGYRPGIVSRGVGGSHHQPCVVRSDSLAQDVGDEAVLMARNSYCPVVVGRDRVAAVASLLQHFPECNVVLSDDGLQHYRLVRDIEIAVVDGARLFGNECLLPAGPLREPLSRLDGVDLVVVNGGELDNAYRMTLKPLSLVSLTDKSLNIDIGNLKGRVHAIAGIGNPDRFFNLLRQLGYEVIEHAFPDHYAFSARDLSFGDKLPVLMTGKDAVKCEQFADNHMWYLDVVATFENDFFDHFVVRLQGVK
jgi:tetraacyldisaccharide 4'-kinase